MTARARIYKPAKNAMQSGKAGSRFWVLEYLPNEHPHVESTMGWTGGGDTVSQLHLKFSSKEEAIKFASQNSLEYVLEDYNDEKVKIKSYIDNFKKHKT